MAKNIKDVEDDIVTSFIYKGCNVAVDVIEGCVQKIVYYVQEILETDISFQGLASEVDVEKMDIANVIYYTKQNIPKAGRCL